MGFASEEDSEDVEDSSPPPSRPSSAVPAVRQLSHESPSDNVVDILHSNTGRRFVEDDEDAVEDDDDEDLDDDTDDDTNEMETRNVC